MEELSDAEVMLRSQRDPAAFALIYERYATTIHRYVTRRVGRRDAEMLMAETFRIAFERRASYDLQRPFARPWLYGIATRLIATHHRTARRQQRAIDRLSRNDAVASDETDRVNAEVDATKRLPEVVNSLGQLPDAERDTLLLHAWEGLSYDDVAAALGVPIGTVRSRINRARKRLRELERPDGEHLVHADVFTTEKERLMTSIAADQPSTANQASNGNEAPSILDHRSRMYPRLAYRNEHAALEYLTRVFGFVERREARIVGTTPDGYEMGEHLLAWLEFGAGLVMIGHANEAVHRIRSPRDAGGATVMINVEVDDIDAHYERAVDQGAEITQTLRDQWYGARIYEAADLEGHQWHFQESHDNIRQRGGTVPS